MQFNLSDIESILKAEEKWCLGQGAGLSGMGPSFERGFVAGLNQARIVLASAAKGREVSGGPEEGAQTPDGGGGQEAKTGNASTGA